MEGELSTLAVRVKGLVQFLAGEGLTSTAELEEGRSVQWPKRCEYNNEDEYTSSNRKIYNNDNSPSKNKFRPHF